MNGSRPVGDAMTKRVLEAARSLHYSASPLARGLVLGRTQTIAVLVPDLANPVFQAALRGITAAAGSDAYHVLVADSQENVAEERTLAVEARRRCDGIVLCGPRMPDEELEVLLPELAPVVLINRRSPGGLAPSVRGDYRTGMAQLLAHLYGLGHRHAAYLSGIATAQSNLTRLEGIEGFTRLHPDFAVDSVQGGVDFESGHAAAGPVTSSGATAVLAFNDLVAMGLLAGLDELGVRVPADVSVTGFDDIPFAAYTTPSLTTVSVPVAELGRQAWQRLSALIHGRRPGQDLSYGPLLVPRRSSSAPAEALVG
jgi:LacI family transcriptional regulator